MSQRYRLLCAALICVGTLVHIQFMVLNAKDTSVIKPTVSEATALAVKSDDHRFDDSYREIYDDQLALTFGAMLTTTRESVSQALDPEVTEYKLEADMPARVSSLVHERYTNVRCVAVCFVPFEPPWLCGEHFAQWPAYRPPACVTSTFARERPPVEGAQRRDSAGYFDVLGDGIVGPAVVSEDGYARLLIRTKTLHSPRCGDDFEVLLTSLDRPHTRSFARLQHQTWTGDYVYAAFVPNRDARYNVTIRHAFQEFHGWYRYPGLMRAWNFGKIHYLHAYLSVSPVILSMRSSGASLTLAGRSTLPPCTCGVMEGAWEDDVYVPAKCSLHAPTRHDFEQCLAERNLCVLLLGDSVTEQVFNRLSALLNATTIRVTFCEAYALQWNVSDTDVKTRMRETRESWERCLRLFERAWWNCTVAHPDARAVIVANSGVHEAARTMFFSNFAHGLEWLVEEMRRRHPDTALLWRRVTAVHPGKYPDNGGKPEQMYADLCNAMTPSRIFAFDWMARRAMAHHGVPVVDFLTPTMSRPDLLEFQDLRHYNDGATNTWNALLYGALCVGPPLRTMRELPSKH